MKANCGNLILKLAVVVLLVSCFSCSKSSSPSPIPPGPGPDTSDIFIKEVVPNHVAKGGQIILTLNRTLSNSEPRPTKVFINGKEFPFYVDGSPMVIIKQITAFGSGVVELEWKGKRIKGTTVSYDSMYYLHTAAGSDFGYVDADSTNAQFRSPQGMCVDAQGNIYIADEYNNMIRKMSRDGKVTTVAGSGESAYKDGQGKQAQFSMPQDVAIDVSGNLFVSDALNHRVRKITPDGTVTTYAGGNGSQNKDGIGEAAGFGNMRGLTVDKNGVVYILSENQVRRITPDRNVTTITGDIDGGWKDGTLAEAKFGNISDVVIDSKGNLFVNDPGINRIRKITTTTVSTFLGGNGTYVNDWGQLVILNYATGLCITDKDEILIADTGNNQTHLLSTAAVITTLPGTIPRPAGIVIAPDKTIYVSSEITDKIYKYVRE